MASCSIKPCLFYPRNTCSPSHIVLTTRLQHRELRYYLTTGCHKVWKCSVRFYMLSCVFYAFCKLSHFPSSHGYRFQASEFYFKSIGNIRLMWIIPRGSEWETCLFHPYGFIVTSPGKPTKEHLGERKKMALFLFSTPKGKTKISSQGAFHLTRSLLC